MRLLLILWAAVLWAQPHENLNAVVWMQNAAEYRAVTLQAFRAAEVNLDRALSDTRWTAALEQVYEYDKLPPAVILDLDETVLDNSPYQARQVLSGKPYDEASWQKWVAEKKAGLVPGAREFLLFAQARGVQLHYVTNRACAPDKDDDPTVSVLRTLALPLMSGRLHCRTETSDKSPRRRHVAGFARVVLLIGDDLNDFVTLPVDTAARASFTDDMHGRWGERWILIPNPSYGSWERGIPDKRKALRP